MQDTALSFSENSSKEKKGKEEEQEEKDLGE